ncbi:MAG TPA: HupE/UreJ family protein [Xanthobacteraceae bacterium]|nr:HupE/UreJ family protein [Xanthobacteraceae bacterium]
MRRALLATALVLAPTLAFAHPGLPGHTHDLASGFAHPFSGVDHVLAMVAVGLFAAQLGGRALWLVPASFVAMMAAAGLVGMSGVALPLTETGIALSIIVLGGAIALRLALPVAAAMALVGFFAIFHGYAHGLETPETASGLLYGFGFVAATAVLHGLGIGIGLALGRLEGAFGGNLVRVAGSAAAVIGVVMLAGAV